jgi:1D-myo-inositol-triphosphate 3-kinase
MSKHGRKRLGPTTQHLNVGGNGGYGSSADQASQFQSPRSSSISDDDSDSGTEKAAFNLLGVQAGGHAYSFYEGGEALPGRLLKALDNLELSNYEEFTKLDDPFRLCAPQFYGVVSGNMSKMEGESSTSASESEADATKTFLILENLLTDRNKPVIMDCKLGVRSFQEKECLKKEPRKDLYERLLQIGPQFLTDAERKAGTMTKYRWMNTRDEMSSLRGLGFRIDGIAYPDGLKKTADYFANISERDKVIDELQGFLRCVAGQTSVDVLKIQIQVAKDISVRLAELHSQCQKSEYVRVHEFVGASLLFVAEASPPRATVHMIDFAKTSKLPDGISVDHMRGWEVGNHEDGLLFGLLQCKSCWDDVIESLETELLSSSLNRVCIVSSNTCMD